MRSRALPLATLAWLAVIALITLLPAPYPAGQPNDVVLAIIAFLGSTPLTGWFDVEVAEFTANVLLFVPLGALVAAQLPRRYRPTAALIGLAVSAAVETAQLLWLPTRVADVRDLCSNGLGSLLGTLLTMALARTSTARRGS
ncbi:MULTISPECIES: VanZ family protein [unclassified Rathayibacter]|uniref:VanZ family protein n=1 Tax=unclassified Rathayibacter TaxID=2609250 RepID=UPI00188A5E85|nr:MULTISPECIES: VanZ family protein [unclassified Rathayibacter]MBF4462551.1 VanZ family protein [Rathayibacter sp. VKM Ac-2879]MBF4503406.1 VanZ family protein [Rathayibacter sp. VKM Ac-2878]